MRIHILITFLCFSIVSCNEKVEVDFAIDGTSIPIDSTLNPDKSITEIYAPYKLGLDSIMNEVLCYSPYFLEKSKPESRLSNWMADVCLSTLEDKYEVDFCLLNYGGIRSTLPKGDITTKNIFQIMPFENELVIIEIPDSSFTKALNYLKQSEGHPISGIELNIQNDQLTHSLNSNGSVKVATSDYLANGGDKMSFFNQKVQKKLNLKLRDAIINHCKRQDTLNITIDQRIIINE